MVDFGKRLKKQIINKATDPIEIYDHLDRKSETGPLRPAQAGVLKKWYESEKNKRDLIIKLHTGAGKTLIGLLMLQSKINSNDGPCLYVCPNIYLVEQVCEEAEKFGINYCRIEKDNELPDSFVLGKSILITYVQKVFNGKSIFGLNAKSTNVGCVVLDDSHACIDSINNSFTINIGKEDKLYMDLLNLFEEDLVNQGEGTFLDIKNSDYESLLPIPYWAWDNKKSEVLKLLSENKDKDNIMYVWPLLKDCISRCKAYISGSKIEISPYIIPIQKFGTFNNAKNRILMSATTQNDSFFIKGLNIDVDAIKNPLIDNSKKWSGEKMILIPSLIDDECDREKIIYTFAKKHTQKLGIVSLVPSFAKAKLYEKYGAITANSNNIYDSIKKLKVKGHREDTLVIANRYDGIDLPDNSCRILILDSLPYFDCLSDTYEELCRGKSEIINVKIAQKIEQGLGRSVRGDKDFCVILIIGSDLVKFIKSSKTNKYFSIQTQKQIDIGLEIADMAKEDLKTEDTSIKVISNLIKQSISRDESWKSYYLENMNDIEEEKKSDNMLDILQLEKEAEQLCCEENYEKACEYTQKIIDIVKDDMEQAWYLQEMARYKYYVSKIESNRIQKVAYKKNMELLNPRDGIAYNKIEYINESRINRIKKWNNQFENYDEFILQINSILDDFSFGKEAHKFEEALKSIGDLLGFISQRPDKIIKKGPDNLWCIKNNQYIMFECKSQVKDDRNEISKDEAGQMNSHCGWFENEYGDSNVKRIMIIPTKNLSYYADFTHEVFIMRKGKLREFKKNIKEYAKEFKPFYINEVSDEKIQEIINFHHLDIESILDNYCESYYKNKK